QQCYPLWSQTSPPTGFSIVNWISKRYPQSHDLPTDKRFLPFSKFLSPQNWNTLPWSIFKLPRYNFRIFKFSNLRIHNTFTPTSVPPSSTLPPKGQFLPWCCRMRKRPLPFPGYCKNP